MKKNILLFCILLSSLTFGQKSYGSNLNATVAFPSGANSKYYNTGYGAIGGFYYELESSWRIGLTLGFMRFGINSNEVNNYFQTLMQGGSIDINGSVSAIPIVLSCKYIIPTRASPKFYGIIEGGLYIYWSKAKGNIIYTSPNSAIVPLNKSEFSSEVGFDLGSGALIPLTDEISIDLNFRYHIVRNSGTIKVKYDEYGNGEESIGSSHFITIGMGINWNFEM